MERLIDSVKFISLKNNDRVEIKKFLNNIKGSEVNLIASGDVLHGVVDEYSEIELIGFIATNMMIEPKFKTKHIKLLNLDNLFRIMARGSFKHIELFHVDNDKFINYQDCLNEIKNNISLFYSKGMVNSAIMDLANNIGKGNKALLEQEKIHYYKQALITFNEIYEFLSTGELIPDRTNIDIGYFKDIIKGRVPLSIIQSNIEDIYKVKFSNLKYYDKLNEKPNYQEISKLKFSLVN